MVRQTAVGLLWLLAAMAAMLAPGLDACAQSGGMGLADDGRKLPVLRSGWYLYEPYQFVDTRRAGVLSGVDIEIAQEISRRLGFHVQYEYMDWHDQVDGVRNGTIDFSEAARSLDLDQIAHFSEPYRTEEIVLLVAPNSAERFTGLDSAQIIEAIEESDLTVGVVDGFSFGENRLGTFIVQYSNSPKIVAAENSTLNIRALVDGKVDVVLADRMSAIGILWKNDLFGEVAEIRLANHPHADIAMMFSKENFAPGIVQRVNTELAALRTEGFLDDAHRKYLVPLFLSQTTHAFWYSVVDFIGTAAFALSGALLAWRLNANLAGFILLSGLPAVGGGIVRDILLGREIWALHSSYSLAIFVGVALLAYVARKVMGQTGSESRLRSTGAALFNFSDAAGLASFTVTGIAVTVTDPVSHPLAWAPFFGALTAAGGGMARDAVVGRSVGTLFSDLYVQISLLFGAALTLYIAITPVRIEPNQYTVAVMLTMIAIVVTRLEWLRRRGALFKI